MDTVLPTNFDPKNIDSLQKPPSQWKNGTESAEDKKEDSHVNV
jgi:hypothetical protein